MDFPLQFSGSPAGRPASAGGAFDMRAALSPRRLAIVMWNQAFLLHHAAGGSFADYDRVLDETLARGYNTLRLDPMPQLIDLAHPETAIAWPDPQAPYMPRLFTDASWHKEFGQRCAVAPMLRAAQRGKLAAFAAWSEQTGKPLTTSESWASWYYFDSPDLDWGWLLEWAEWSVEDAIEYRMWGWTPHNYCQPQFTNWQDAAWHRRLTEKFLCG